MQKITKERFDELSNNSFDCYRHPQGNYWIFHCKSDGLFYPVLHKSTQYWECKPTKYFTEIISAIHNFNVMSPASTRIFRR